MKKKTSIPIHKFENKYYKTPLCNMKENKTGHCDVLLQCWKVSETVKSNNLSTLGAIVQRL